MMTATDRKASIKTTILRGDALTAFEASLEESQDGNEDDVEEVLTLTTEMIDVGLTDVSKTIFPHRACWRFRSSGCAEQSGSRRT
jgi:hypothetical protein